MANVLDPMDIKQIFSLYRDGLSNRKIASVLGISRNTVNQYIAWLTASDYGADEIISLNDGKLREIFPSRTTIRNDTFDALVRYFEQGKAARNHPGVTFLYHFEEYRKSADEPYSYTQFMEHYRRRYARTAGSMKLEHLPGHEVILRGPRPKPLTGIPGKSEKRKSLWPYCPSAFSLMLKHAGARNGMTCCTAWTI